MSRKIGKIKFFNEEKGFGFITDPETGKDVFLHVTNVEGITPEANDEVSFETELGKKGVEARKVRVVQD